MGMTLWIHTLEDRDYSRDSDDYSLMYRFAEQLDALCESAHVRKLTDYFDFTDLEYSYREEDSEEPDLDPETELPYGIDEMHWCNATDGMMTLTALHDRVNADALEGLATDEKQGLREELTSCIAILQRLVSRESSFPLAIVA